MFPDQSGKSFHYRKEYAISYNGYHLGKKHILVLEKRYLSSHLSLSLLTGISPIVQILTLSFVWILLFTDQSERASIITRNMLFLTWRRKTYSGRREKVYFLPSRSLSLLTGISHIVQILTLTFVWILLFTDQLEKELPLSQVSLFLIIDITWRRKTYYFGLREKVYLLPSLSFFWQGNLPSSKCWRCHLSESFYSLTNQERASIITRQILCLIMDIILIAYCFGLTSCVLVTQCVSFTIIFNFFISYSVHV